MSCPTSQVLSQKSANVYMVGDSWPILECCNSTADKFLSRQRRDTSVDILWIRNVEFISMQLCVLHYVINLINSSCLVIIRVSYPRAGPSLQAQESRLQFCRRQVFGTKTAVLPGTEQMRQLPVVFRTPHSLQHQNRH